MSAPRRPLRFRAWLANIPITHPVDRQMAALLQVILIGLMVILILAVGLIFTLPFSVDSPLALAVRVAIALLILGIPLFLLRRGYFRSSVYVIIAILLLLMTFVVFHIRLREVAENLTFFTLALVLAGLLTGPRALWTVLIFSVLVVFAAAFREQDPTRRLSEIAIAINFSLLNGLMSVFIYYFGNTLRNSLTSALRRESQLQQEVMSRKLAEEKVNLLNEELGKQVGELERFTYTVSHDLRSPVVTIKGFIGMLQSDIKNQRPDKVQHDMQRIANATDKMDELLSDLLELSRVGRIANPAESVDLRLLVQEAVETLDARLHSQNVEILIDPNLPSVEGDRVRLREVFENLIDNAAKYMGDQKHPRIEIGITPDQVIFVRDNGLGIEPQYTTRIFGLFEKLNPTIEGTGIGLALVKRIVEVHGGKIWIESDGLGKGSTFYFTIPDPRQ